MRKTIILSFTTILMFICITLCYGQQSTSVDKVSLKNGSIIKGIITELLPGKTIKIKISDGNLLVYNYDELLSIEKIDLQSEAANGKEQENEYLQNQLTIQVEQQGLFAVNTYSGLGSYSTSTSWQAFKGANNLTEAEFFTTLGDAQKAQESKSHKLLKSWLTWGGLGAGLLGCVIMLSYKGDYKDMTQLEIGAVLGILGLTIEMIGVFGISENIVNAGYAKTAADIYNKNLKIKLKLAL